MSIIRYSTLSEENITKLENFLSNTAMPSKEEVLCWLRLWKLWGKVNIYLAKFGCIFKTLEHILSINSVNTQILSISEAEKIYEEAKNYGIEILIPTHPSYPPSLKEIQDFPMVLYAFGNLEILKKPMFAIVGSRSTSAEAMQITYNFANEIAQKGITIVSGFAQGIDTSACNGALKHGTVQVLGSGIKNPYPQSNNELFAKVLSNHGLFISEFPPSFPAKPSNFPTRNRIITGLSSGILIGQINRRNGISGTLVTLRIAISQGKDIFAYPGNILDERYKISNDLLKNGTAHFVTNTQDILNIIGESSNSAKKQEKIAKHTQKFEQIIQNENTPVQQNLLNSIEDSNETPQDKIYNTLSTRGISVNEIIAITGFSASFVQEILTELELCGKITMNHIGKYTRALI